MDKLTVKVPATTANLGPGFDVLGAALSLYLTVNFDINVDRLKISGCPEEYQNEDNMIFQAYCAVLQRIGINNKNVAIDISSEIPISRGLGSSASLLVAGAIGANELFGSKLSQAELLEITTKIEGHPDNLAPAIYGGMTASFMNGDKPITKNLNVNPSWKFIAMVPDFKLSTELARNALPESYNLNDITHNVSRCALLTQTISDNDEELLSLCLKDKIHQNYRKHLIDDYDVIEPFTRDNCIPFCISGAGPTLLCITNNESKIKLIKEQIPEITSRNWKILELSIDTDGATTNH